jgi:hypothetical protein
MSYEKRFYDDISFSSHLWNALIGGGFRSMLLSLVWALYWMRSKRVRLTYGTAGFERPMALDGSASAS